MKPLLHLLAGVLLFSSIAVSQNSCLVLDGVDDALVVPAATGLSGVTEFTLEAWVRSDSSNPGNKVIDMGTLAHRWEMSIGSGNEQNSGMLAYAGDLNTPIAWADGNWHHWAFTDDGVSVRFYFDGVLVDTQPALGIVWNMNGLPIQIGRRVTTLNHYWDGAIDELRIWRVARSGQEILDGMFYEISGAPGLVSSFHLNGDATDAMGNNDATILGGASFGPASPASAVLSYAGSRDDLILRTGINGPATVFPDIKLANSGDQLLVNFSSPQGAFDFTPPYLAAQLFLQGNPPFQPIDYPEVRLDFAPGVYFQLLVLYDGTGSPFSTGLLPPGGVTFGYNIPPNLAGLSLMIQGFVLAPSGVTGNGWFTCSDGHEVRFS